MLILQLQLKMANRAVSVVGLPDLINHVFRRPTPVRRHHIPLHFPVCRSIQTRTSESGFLLNEGVQASGPGSKSSPLRGGVLRNYGEVLG